MTVLKTMTIAIVIISDYSSCDSSPCKNNAACSNIPDDYTCLCRSGWSGKTCENGKY